MPLDDDLFDDNEVIIDDDALEAEENGESKIFADSPQFHKLIEGLQRELENIDDFSFILFSRTYHAVLDHVHYLFRLLSDGTAINFVAMPEFALSGGSHSFQHIQQLKEFQRAIMASGYFTETIGHIIARLKDNPSCSHHDSYVKFCYDHLLREYSMSTFYLGWVIDKYTAFCEANNFPVDSTLVEHQILSYIGVTERQLYGEFVHAGEIEYVGQFPNAADLKDEFNSKNASFLADFIFAIQEILSKIKAGDTTDLFKEFE